MSHSKHNCHQRELLNVVYYYHLFQSQVLYFSLYVAFGFGDCTPRNGYYYWEQITHGPQGFCMYLDILSMDNSTVVE